MGVRESTTSIPQHLGYEKQHGIPFGSALPEMPAWPILVVQVTQKHRVTANRCRRHSSQNPVANRKYTRQWPTELLYTSCRPGRDSFPARSAPPRTGSKALPEGVGIRYRPPYGLRVEGTASTAIHFWNGMASGLSDRARK